MERAWLFLIFCEKVIRPRTLINNTKHKGEKKGKNANFLSNAKNTFVGQKIIPEKFVNFQAFSNYFFESVSNVLVQGNLTFYTNVLIQASTNNNTRDNN